MSRVLPEKQAALRQLLGSGPALLHIDPRRPDVALPPSLVDRPVLQIKVSWNFSHALSIDDAGVEQTLTFPDGAYHCVIPWAALFAVGPVGGAPRWVWPHSLPDEMLELMQQAVTDTDEEGPAPHTSEDTKAPIQRGHLRLVKSSPETENAEP